MILFYCAEFMIVCAFVSTIKQRIFFRKINLSSNLKVVDYIHISFLRYVLGNLRFGHSDTMDTFYSALGLYHDSQPLRADNYAAMKNRMFYESKTTPFSANIAFILYNCGGNEAENYLLKMMVNNQPVTIPGCDSDFCPYLKVRSIYRNYIENCKWRELCNVRTISQAVG